MELIVWGMECGLMRMMREISVCLFRRGSGNPKRVPGGVGLSNHRHAHQCPRKQRCKRSLPTTLCAYHTCVCLKVLHHVDAFENMYVAVCSALPTSWAFGKIWYAL